VSEEQLQVIPPAPDSGIPGVLLNGEFWHWNEDVTSASIALRKGRDSARKSIGWMAIGVIAASLLGFVLYVVSAGVARVFQVSFWTDPQLGLAPFFLAVLCGCFLFYWKKSKELLYAEIPSVEEGTHLDVRVIPSLAAASKRKHIDTALTEEGRKMIEEAFLLAKEGGHTEVLPVHLFVGGMMAGSSQILLMRLGATFEKTKGPIRRQLGRIEKGNTDFGVAIRNVLAHAFLQAAEHGRPHVGPVELLEAAYEQDAFLQELLYSISIEKRQFAHAIEWQRMTEKLRDRHAELRKAAAFKPTGAMNRAYTSVATPFLDRVSEDLTTAAVRGHLPMLVGREREISQIFRAIEGGRKSVVLIGENGVGKQALLYGLAERMAAEKVPKIFQDKRLVRISVPHIVSSGGPGSADERFLHVLREVGQSGNIILVIEHIDQLMQGGHDIPATLRSELEKGYTFVLATSTPGAYTASVERSILGEVFEKIAVEELDQDSAITVLQSKLGGIENTNKVIFTYEAVEALVEYSARYVHDAALPEKAIVLAKEVGNVVGAEEGEWNHVTKEHVAETISEKTRVPVTEVSEGEGEKLLHLEERMHERVIGQEEAVKVVASALRRARAGLQAEGRPIANFLFLGPTGVGKTETAKTTAEVYFGSEDAMLRFDMSEYQDKASIVRLIGGAGEAGQLTEAVRQNPFALLLLDELEKAHPDILNLFLQVMDDGRLTDGAGRTVDFTNVILIATSNAGTSFIQDAVTEGQALEFIKEALLENELKQTYRPEFLNRFDGIMVFKPLSKEDVVAIAYLMIRSVTKRLEAKGLAFTATDQAVHELAEKGYDPKFGARPLRRVVQETVDNAVAEFLLKGEVERRDTLVLEPGGQIRVEKAAEL